MKSIDHRIGVLLSAGGAAFVRAALLSGLDPATFFVIADRECGAEESCADAGIPCRRIPYSERRSFSHQVATAFREEGCKIALLHYSRLVTPDLFGVILTVNTHPSLLPAYPGLDGVGDAYKANSLFQGATLHIVDEGIDTGNPIVQTIRPVPKGASLQWRNRLGFIQKTIVTLFLFDMAAQGRINIQRRDISAFDLSGLVPGEFSNPGFPNPGTPAAVKQLFSELPANADWTG
ncbi:MAG: formyltransferase family protein [Parvibaculum sp.]|uniref:formyltransferase family protein n=1 Tax=Parvibaculum sp. TaxID=2024848 RepID=UPI002AB837A4|nr:formyltransferase family protein [Parvibaculum sp.]MDZ4381593.1 formyltransferase family protein [Parvibaculum sp.]